MKWPTNLLFWKNVVVSAGRAFRTLVPPPPQAVWVTGPTGGSVYYHNGKTYIGFLDNSANVRVASYNHATGQVVISPTIVTMPSADAHATPSVIVRSSDSKVLVAVAPHAAAHLYVAVSTNAEDVSAFGAATDIVASIAATSVTYCYLIQLSAEAGKIWLFFREGVSSTGTLWYTTSTDGGATWAAETKLYNAPGFGTYWSIDSDDVSRIDFIAGDGTATVGVNPNTTASLFHFYYQGGHYFKSDGTQIVAALPLAPTNITKIYDGVVNGGLDQPNAVLTNGGNPVACWAAVDPANIANPERYWYARCVAGAWTVGKVDTIGETGGVGGIAIDPIDVTKTYVSRKTNGLFNISRYATTDGGATWAPIETVTSDAGEVNTGLLAPRHAVAAVRCVWLFGAYPVSINNVDQDFNYIRSAPGITGVV